jgi:hypothetical protein
MDYEKAIKYIKDVLENWTAWKEHHQYLAEALKVIVEHADNGGNNP